MALLIPVPQQSQLFSRLLVLLIPVLRQLIVVFRCPRLHVAEEGHAARERHPRGHARSVAAPPGRQHRALSDPDRPTPPRTCHRIRCPPHPPPRLRNQPTNRLADQVARARPNRQSPRGGALLGLGPPPRTRAALDGCFSACRPALPADVRAQPSSPRTPSPGGRPRGPAPRPGQQRGCPSDRTAGGGPRGDAA